MFISSLVCLLIGRSPHGERGLKSSVLEIDIAYLRSLPAWGAWIEIAKDGLGGANDRVAPRMGSVD